ncbi:MAG TPA: VOC family protein [Acidimicrobiales bacterium]|jgi:hypothetical protein
MAEMTEYQPGTPSWVDLSAPDPDAAARFYGELLGWQAHPSPEPEAGGYVMMTLRGHNVAGIGPIMAEGQPPAWATYVSTADADATAAAVRDAGGAVVMEPMDIMQEGRLAIFADPGGAVFGVWQPRNHKGAGLVNEPGSLCWNELLTRDVEGAKTFYGAVFGWEFNTQSMGPMDYTVVMLGDRGIAGMMDMTGQLPDQVPPHWGVYFAVDDTDATMAKVQELGGSVTAGPMDIPDVGRMAALADPHGAAFNVLQFPASDQ